MKTIQLVLLLSILFLGCKKKKDEPTPICQKPEAISVNGDLSVGVDLTFSLQGITSDITYPVIWKSNGQKLGESNSPQFIHKFLAEGDYALTAEFKNNCGESRVITYSLKLVSPVINAKAFPIVANFLGYSKDSAAVAILNDGSFLLYEPSNDRLVASKIVLYKYVSGARVKIKTFDLMERPAIMFLSPDEKYLFFSDVSFSGSQTVSVIDMRTGQLVASLSGRTNGIYHVTISNDGKYVGISGLNTIRIWDTSNWQLLRTIELPKGFNEGPPIGGVTINGNLVASISKSPVIQGRNYYSIVVWNIITGAELWKQQLKADFDYHVGYTPGTGILFSPNGKRLLIYRYKAYNTHQIANQGIEIWNFETKRLEKEIDTYGGLPIDVSADGKYLAVGGAVYNFDGYGLMYDFGNQIPKFSPNGSKLIYATRERNLESEVVAGIEIATGASLSGGQGTGHQYIVISASTEIPSTKLFTLDIAGVGKVWDYSSGNLISSFDTGTYSYYELSTAISGVEL